MRKISFAGLLLLGLLLASCSSVPTFSMSELPDSVTVTNRDGWITLSPRASVKPVGLVFYPGGLVKPEAYLKALAPIAAAGYAVLVAQMPFDLAFFDADKGLRAHELAPGVKRWAIGGHSLGGVAAAILVSKHPETFAGIVFWASYPAKENSLSGLPLAALSVSASNDGLATPAKFAAAEGYFPAATIKVVLEGGIHAQFADYGPQKGDGTATLSRDEQQNRTARATIDFLDKISPSP